MYFQTAGDVFGQRGAIERMIGAWRFLLISCCSLDCKFLNAPRGHRDLNPEPGVGATMGKGYIFFMSRTVWLPLWEKDILYIQNSLVATMGKGYSLHPEQSGRHYVKGIFLLGQPQSVFPFA